jgi:hypothetical protein
MIGEINIKIYVYFNHLRNDKIYLQSFSQNLEHLLVYK